MTAAERFRRRRRAITLYLSGFSYHQVADELHLSASHMRHVIGPDLDTRRVVWYRASGRCETCQVPTANGHLHHQHREQISPAEFNTPQNLLYLCLACHRKAHRNHRLRRELGWTATFGMQPNPKSLLIRPSPYFPGWR